MTYSQSLSIQKNQVYRRGQNTYSMARMNGQSRASVDSCYSTHHACLSARDCILITGRSSQIRWDTLYRVARATRVRPKERESPISMLKAVTKMIEKIKSSQVAGALTAVKPSAYAN